MMPKTLLHMIKMKSIGIIIILALFALSCKAQIIAVEDFEDYPNELADGAYIKDINNVLGKYVGNWKGTYNNRNYEFRVIKQTFENNKLKYKEDRLLMRYQITDLNGSVIATTLHLPDDNVYVIKGSYLSKSGSYVLNYQGLNAECGQNGNIYISVHGVNNSKLSLFLLVHGEVYPECTVGSVEQILPTDWIEMIKQ